MITVPLLTTRRCILRPLADIDLQRIWDATRLPDLADHPDWQPPSNRNALDGLPSRERREAAAGKNIPFTLVSRRGIFLGRVILENRDGTWHLGYWLLPSARGKGYLTEAAEAVLRFAFEVLNAPRVESALQQHNGKGAAALERLGMTQSGTRTRTTKAGATETLLTYALLQEEWQAAHLDRLVAALH